MINKALCPKCNKGGWDLMIDYHAKEIIFTCLQCGYDDSLTNIFGMRRKKRRIKNEVNTITEVGNQTPGE